MFVNEELYHLLYRMCLVYLLQDGLVEYRLPVQLHELFRKIAAHPGPVARSHDYQIFFSTHNWLDILSKFKLFFVYLRKL